MDNKQLPPPGWYIDAVDEQKAFAEFVGRFGQLQDRFFSELAAELSTFAASS
ncbi:hypothetical protein F183_A29550 [Bryobacterales bacterium F-183]|nr:hypothetical protein F183_A29550 [Bryobacterales bacterium F-183]